MRNDTNHCLDCLKGIACICVVFVHVHFPGWFGDILWRLSQFAVPIFFMISGYFAYNCTNDVLKRRAKRILWLSLWTTALQLDNKCHQTFFKERLFLYTGGTDVLLLMIRFIFLQDVDFSGGFHLWFLWALFWAYIVVLGINRFALWTISYKVLPMLVVAMVILSILRRYYGWDFHSTGNLSCSVTYMLIGHWLAANSVMVKDMMDNKLLFTMLLGFVISLGYFLQPMYDFSQVGIIMASVAMFALAINNKDFVLSRKLEIIGYRYSLNVYVFHVLVYCILMKVENMAGFYDNMIILATQPILVVLCTLVVALFISQMFKKY